MLDFIAFTPWHIAELAKQKSAIQWTPGMLAPDYAKALATGMALSATVDGKVVGCAGFVPLWPGRVLCWGLFGEIPRQCWPRVVRRIRDGMEEAHAAGVRRIEAHVVYGFGTGCRLMHLLGFEVEGIARKYAIDGSDCFQYSRVR